MPTERDPSVTEAEYTMRILSRYTNGVELFRFVLSPVAQALLHPTQHFCVGGVMMSAVQEQTLLPVSHCMPHMYTCTMSWHLYAFARHTCKGLIFVGRWRQVAAVLQHNAASAELVINLVDFCKTRACK